MKIAVGTRTFPRLSETFVLGPIVRLLEAGHDVRIFALRKGDETVVHPDVERHALLERTTVLGPARGAMATFKRLTHSLHPKPTHGRFDAVWVHFGNVAEDFRIHMEHGALSGPLYPVFHGYDITSRVKKLPPGAYQPLFEFSRRLLPISDLFRRRLIELGAPEEKVIVHRMGLPVSEVPFRNPRSGPKQRLEVLSIARLVEKKGIEWALRGIARFGQLKPEGTSLRYRIVGEGPLRSDLQRLAEDLKIAHLVEFLGGQPSDKVDELLYDSHVLLLPSVTARSGDMEGLPVVLMEAMARGLPVVATRHSGIPELMNDDRGRLIPEADAEAIANALLEHASGKVDLETTSQNARAAVQQAHDLDVLTKDLIRLFEENRASPSQAAETSDSRRARARKT